MKPESIGVFVKVAQSGSFTAAARVLGMPNSTVSERVSDLKKSLGITLLQRTTRKLHLTDSGERFFQRGVRALDDIVSARNEIEDAASAPHGVLRVTVPVDIGHWVLPQIVKRFQAQHPQVALDLVVMGQGVSVN